MSSENWLFLSFEINKMLSKEGKKLANNYKKCSSVIAGVKA